MTRIHEQTFFIIVWNGTNLPDTNMNTAYSWASDLSDLSHLKMTLNIRRMQLILEIHEVVGRHINYDLISGRSGVNVFLRPLKKFSLIGLMIW